MSQLKDQLSADFKEAMLQRDSLRKEVVQLIRAGILQIEKDEKIEADDELVMSVVRKELKKRRELLTEIQDRPEAVEKTEKEMAFLEGYLPKALSKEELQTLVKETVAELNAQSMKDMGRTMKAVLEKAEGRAEGGDVSALLKELLS